jgi:hypothetical protein
VEKTPAIHCQRIVDPAGNAHVWVGTSKKEKHVPTCRNSLALIAKHVLFFWILKKATYSGRGEVAERLKAAVC